eukprot:320704-Pleurochrysis_carterae.AAC.1
MLPNRRTELKLGQALRWWHTSALRAHCARTRDSTACSSHPAPRGGSERLLCDLPPLVQPTCPRKRRACVFRAPTRQALPIRFSRACRAACATPAWPACHCAQSPSLRTSPTSGERRERTDGARTK